MTSAHTSNLLTPNVDVSVLPREKDDPGSLVKADLGWRVRLRLISGTSGKWASLTLTFWGKIQNIDISGVIVSLYENIFHLAQSQDGDGWMTSGLPFVDQFVAQYTFLHIISFRLHKNLFCGTSSWIQNLIQSSYITYSRSHNMSMGQNPIVWIARYTVLRGNQSLGVTK